ncbi:hypothetical protein ACF06Q_29250 [Streptomyces leeuwenhoekii]|uniref:hypothetical protein n=1 Tax=Streptomyces leeuwenhoekii TaxID=1437453 RepID=UPI00370304CE
MTRDAATCGGCLLSAAGATAATLWWGTSGRTRRHLGDGFEGEGTDYGVLVTELPLVAVAGAVLPALAWGLVAYALSRRRRSERHR